MLCLMALVRSSKYFAAEKPYIVKGNIKLTGSEEPPKDRYMDSDIGTWKAVNVEACPYEAMIMKSLNYKLSL